MFVRTQTLAIGHVWGNTNFDLHLIKKQFNHNEKNNIAVNGDGYFGF